MNEEKLTPEEIQAVLEEHRLWLDSNREKGKRADFSGKNLQEAHLVDENLRMANLFGANLEGANLEGANLFGANLEGANLGGAYLFGAILEGAILRRANLYGANLRRANLRRAILRRAILRRANLFGAILEGAILEGAILEGANLNGVIGFENTANTSFLTKNIQHYEQTISRLEKELQQAEAARKNNEADQEQVQKSQAEIGKLKEEIENAKSGKEQAEESLKKLKEELDNLKKELRDRINDAKKSLASALTNTDTQIKSNNKYAKWFGWGGMAVFSIAFCALIGIPIYIWCNNLFPENNWHLLFYTFPVIAMILIATTLLRHQKSLLNEVRHFSNMKHQIELYSGLLEASQHAAASFGDPKKADEYVQQTFTQIRDRLLQVQLSHDQPLAPASEEPADSNHLIGLLSKIADLGSKKLG